MSLDTIVNVSISRETAGVTQAGFGTALILGPNAFSGEVRQYTSLTALAEDFETTDPEYIMASKYFGQQPRSRVVKVGLAALTARVITMTPTVQNNADYDVTIGPDAEVPWAYTYTSDADATDAEIVAGLIALINADTSEHGVTASGTTTLILTGVAGAAFDHDNSANLADVVTTAGVSIADAINAAIAIDNDWYFLLTVSAVEEVVLTAAATIEALRKLYIARSASAIVRTAATSDIASRLKDAGYFRTGLFYTGTAADYGDAAFVGKLAPLAPGSETWAYKTLAGVTVDNWTDTEKGFLNTKNTNYYVSLAGVSTTFNGKAAGGEFLDIMRFIDWLTARIQEGVFGRIVNLPKIPFTDKGIAVVESEIRAVLERGVAAGGIASSQDYTVTVPKAADVPANDKAQRLLTGVAFTAVLAGAIHAVEISGTVTL